MLQVSQLKTAAWVLLGLWAAVFLLVPLRGNDPWFHLATGQWLLDHGSFPALDPFSWPSHQAVWLKRSWLFSVLAAGVKNLAGLSSLVVFAMLSALLTGTLLLRRASKAKIQFPILFILTVLAAFATRLHWQVRPQSLGQLALVLGILLWDTPKRRQRLLGLFLLAALWSNLHASVLLFTALTALRVLLPAPAGRQRVFEDLCAVFLGSLLNPQGAGEWLQTSSYLMERSSDHTAMIREWTPLAWNTNKLSWLACLLIPALAFKQKPKRAETWMLLALALLTLRFRRFVPFFWLSSLAFIPLWLPAALNKNIPRAAILISLFILSASIIWMAAKPMLPLEPKIHRWGVSTLKLPVAAADFLLAHPPGGRLGHLYDQGSYLMYRLGPMTKVFIDTRLEPYPDQVFNDVIKLEQGSPRWKQIMQNYKMTAFLVPRVSPLAALLITDTDWKPVWADAQWGLFATRKEPAIERGEWTFRKPH